MFYSTPAIILGAIQIIRDTHGWVGRGCTKQCQQMSHGGGDLKSAKTGKHFKFTDARNILL